MLNRGELNYRKRLKRRTLLGKIGLIYDNQILHSKERGHNIPEYSKDDFISWCTKSLEFNSLYLKWVDSNYLRDLSPSIDRIDDSKGYSFDNIQVMPWKDNRDKYFRDKVNGINTSDMKAIYQIDLINNSIINEFYSAAQASRFTRIIRTNICKCARGERKSAGGYGWKYK